MVLVLMDQERFLRMQPTATHSLIVPPPTEDLTQYNCTLPVVPPILTPPRPQASTGIRLWMQPSSHIRPPSAFSGWRGAGRQGINRPSRYCHPMSTRYKPTSATCSGRPNTQVRNFPRLLRCVDMVNI